MSGKLKIGILATTLLLAVMGILVLVTMRDRTAAPAAGHDVRALVAGVPTRLRVCTSCIQAGRVIKNV